MPGTADANTPGLRCSAQSASGMILTPRPPAPCHGEAESCEGRRPAAVDEKWTTSSSMAAPETAFELARYRTAHRSPRRGACPEPEGTWESWSHAELVQHDPTSIFFRTRSHRHPRPADRVAFIAQDLTNGHALPQTCISRQMTTTGCPAPPHHAAGRQHHYRLAVPKSASRIPTSIVVTRAERAQPPASHKAAMQIKSRLDEPVRVRRAGTRDRRQRGPRMDDCTTPRATRSSKCYVLYPYPP